MIHLGTLDYWAAHRWLWKTGRWTWMVWPLCCSLLLFPVYVWGVWAGSDALTDHVLVLWGGSSDGWHYWLLWPFIVLITLFLGYILLKNLIMLLCLPLNMRLADAVINEQLGDTAAQGWQGLSQSFGRTLSVTLLSLCMGLISTVGLLLIGLIPVIGPIAALVLGLIVQSFLAAWGFFDPVYERVHLGAWRSLGRSIRLTPTLVGSGLPFVLLFQIPILGWALAPSYGTVAGALTASRLHQQGRLLAP